MINNGLLSLILFSKALHLLTSQVIIFQVKLHVRERLP